MSNRVVSNFIWKFLERWGAQGVTFIVSIVLARILNPEVYGILAIVTVFTTLLQVFIDSGLGTALIQKEDADDLDFSTVFWFNVIACFLLYILIFLCAPFIAAFYKMPELVQMVRILGTTIIISGVKGIQQSYVAKNLMFKKFFFSTLGGTIGAAILGIILAYNGFGAWALIAQYLFNNLIDTIILWLTVKWRPKKIFSFKRFKVLFGYGWKLLVSSLIDTLYSNIRTLIIGKVYTSSELAYYEKGIQFPRVAVENINSSLNSVLLPVLAQKQRDIDAVKSASRRVIRTSSFLIWPMMMGLFAVADNFIVIILTEKWLPCVIFLRVLCFNQVLQPLQTTNLSVIKALGKSDLHLKLEIIKKTIAITLVICSSFVSVKAIAISSVIYAVIASIINSYPNKKLIQYGYFEQIRDVLPYAMLSMVMGLVVWIINFINMGNGVKLVVQIIVGIIFYIVGAYVFKFEELNSCSKIVVGMLKIKKNG